MKEKTLPEGWEVKPFAECIKKEVSLNKFKIPQSKFLEKGKYAIIDQSVEFIAGYTNDLSKVFKDDLPVVIFGDHTRIFKFIDFPFALGADGTKILVPKKEMLNPKYFYFHLKGLRIENHGYSRHYKLLKENQILLPPLPTQKKIAAILTTVDETIEETEHIIKSCERIKKELMQTLLMKGLPGKHISFENTQFGMIPGKWTTVTLNDVASNEKNSFVDGPFGSNLKVSDYTSEGIQLIQLQNIGDGEFIQNSNVKFTSEEKYQELIRHAVFPGDIVISKMAEPIARCCLVNASHDRYLAVADCVRLKVNEDEFDKNYVMNLMNSPIIRNIAYSRGTGTTRRRIGLTELKRLPFLKPPLTEQKEIASRFSSINDRIIVEKQKKSQLEILKKGLMQKLLTGEVRVKVN